MLNNNSSVVKLCHPLLLNVLIAVSVDCVVCLKSNEEGECFLPLYFICEMHYC